MQNSQKLGHSILTKFLDDFNGTDRDMNALFVNYDTSIPVDFKNLERENNQNAGRNFKPKEVKLFGIESTLDPLITIWNSRTEDSYMWV